jgi:hypothetical protein
MNVNRLSVVRAGTEAFRAGSVEGVGGVLVFFVVAGRVAGVESGNDGGAVDLALEITRDDVSERSSLEGKTCTRKKLSSWVQWIGMQGK